ncbi:hypothetical protein GGI12_003166, partial [Dipsacomyces acuminosporus]
METASAHLAECPVKPNQEAPYLAICPAKPSQESLHLVPENEGIHIIVVEKGKDPQLDGLIIGASASDSSLSEFRKAVASRFLPDAPATVLPSAIALQDPSGNAVNTFAELSQLRVVYLAHSIAIKEAPMLPGYPLVGIIPYTVSDPRRILNEFFESYGDAVHFYMFGEKMFSTRDPAVIRELMHDSEYFIKNVRFPLTEIKEFAGDGLFTSSSDEDVWKHAHRLLMPAFSASAMKIYAEEMVHVAEKASGLVSMYGPQDDFDAVDFTIKITFQAIGQVALGYDFHLMDAIDSPTHPFLVAMNFCMNEAGRRVPRTKYWKHLPINSNYEFDRQLGTMKSIMKEVIDQRRNSPDATNMKKDLLGFMLNARAPNPQGEVVGLSDDNIYDQIITFGIAGSETSANTLSWVLYLLEKHPEIQQRVLQELANIGITPDKPVTVKQCNQLTYLTQVIKETLRLFPPVGMLSKVCSKDCILPGGYIVHKGTQARIFVWGLHRNPKIYPDPYRFDPERFNKENIKKIPEGGWLPFSSGPRACIGMQFAMMEMRIVLATLLSRYKFSVADGGEVTYAPRAVTAKPDNLRLVVSKREDYPQPSADGELGAISDSAATSFDLRMVSKAAESAVVTDPALLPSVVVAYGSNMGTSEDYAIQISEKLKVLGYADVAVKPLDDWDYAAAKPADGKKSLVIVITSTYNGVPPDNANKFAKAIAAESRTDLLKGVDYLVFG